MEIVSSMRNQLLGYLLGALEPDEQRALDGTLSKPDADWGQNQCRDAFLTKSCLVDPGCAQPGHRKSGCIDDPAQAGVIRICHQSDLPKCVDAADATH